MNQLPKVVHVTLEKGVRIADGYAVDMFIFYFDDGSSVITSCWCN